MSDGTQDRRLTRHLVVAAVVTAVIAVVVYLVMVHTATGHRLDNAALLGSQQQSESTRLGKISNLRRISADSFAVVLALIAAFGIIRRRARLGVAMAATAAVTVIVTDLLRRALLSRPLLVHSDSADPINTFPSGHTATAIVCALAIVVVSPPAWRGVSAVLAGSYAWITAAAVQTAGWHRPSDAIGAALLAFSAVASTAAVIAAVRPLGRGRRYAHLPAFVVLGVVWLVAAATSAINAARVLRYLDANDDSLTPTQPILNDAYHFSLNLTIVVVVTLLAALLILLGSADLDEPASAATSTEATADPVATSQP
jgi:PAP2 superfamily